MTPNTSLRRTADLHVLARRPRDTHYARSARSRLQRAAVQLNR